MIFTKKQVAEGITTVELFAEGGSSSKDNSKNTGACKNDTNVNVTCKAK